jgi:hypothetical protein
VITGVSTNSSRGANASGMTSVITFTGAAAQASAGAAGRYIVAAIGAVWKVGVVF